MELRSFGQFRILFHLPFHESQLLSAQQITLDGPGSILRDVATIIEFIGEAGMPTSSKLGKLPSGPLAILNAKLSAPIHTRLKRPLLTSYPNISGISILLRVIALVRIEGKRVTLDRDALALRSGLNPTEQYFALLEAWLWHADPKIIGEDAHGWFGQHYCASKFLNQLNPTTWKKFEENSPMLFMPGTIAQWNSFLMHQFGLIEMEALPVAVRVREGCGYGWRLGRARLIHGGRGYEHADNKLSCDGVCNE